jgi:ribose-phosphate pyrophosphokinase
MKIFTGSSNKALAKEIVDYLDIDLGRSVLEQFSDGEVHFYIDENVRGEDVFVIQTGAHDRNFHLMELFVMIDAFKRASAERITAVMPYYAYARQDWKDRPRVPVSARLVADLLEAAGANRVLTMDLHSPQIQGFFSVPVDNLMAQGVFAAYVRKMRLEDVTVFSPDAGGVGRAKWFAKLLTGRHDRYGRDPGAERGGPAGPGRSQGQCRRHTCRAVGAGHEPGQQLPHGKVDRHEHHPSERGI